MFGKKGLCGFNQPEKVLELWNTMAKSKEQESGHWYVCVEGAGDDRKMKLVKSKKKGSDLDSINDFILTFINTISCQPEQLFLLENAYMHLFPGKTMSGAGQQMWECIHSEFEKKCKIELTRRFGEFLKENNIDVETLKKVEGELLWALDQAPMNVAGNGQANLLIPIESSVTPDRVDLIQQYASSGGFQKTFKNLYHVDNVNVPVIPR